MPRLEWDKIGEHIYETGVDRGVLYQLDAQKAFVDGVAWSGLTAVNESPSGAESTALYADNIKYLNLISAEEYGLTIECYTYPDEFAVNNGEASLLDGVSIGQQTRKPFGFCYRTLVGNDTEGTNKGYKIHCVYNCQASPSETSHSTVNDSPEAANPSFTITTTPVNVTGHKATATVTIDSTKLTDKQIKAIEAVLYGGDNTEPRLPLPDEIATIIQGAA